MMKFSVIGPSGYIGKRHIDAINSNNGEVVSYFDINECNLFNEKTSFFTQENDFFDSLRDSKPDFCVVCSPNYLHCKHIVLSLKSGIEVISEKPVWTVWTRLRHIDKKTGLLIEFFLKKPDVIRILFRWLKAYLNFQMCCCHKTMYYVGTYILQNHLLISTAFVQLQISNKIVFPR